MSRDPLRRRSIVIFRPEPLETCEARALLSGLPMTGMPGQAVEGASHHFELAPPIGHAHHNVSRHGRDHAHGHHRQPTGYAHPLLKVLPNATPGPTGYSPTQIKTAYGFSQLPTTNQGAGQTIYIIDAYDDPTISSDLSYFSSYFGLPQMDGKNGDPTFTKATPQGSPKTNSGWALEISLDVEWAHAIAPQANITLVEAASNSNTNLYGAVDYAVNSGAKIVSMSFGGGDSSGELSLDSHFAIPGVSFVASAGDSGGVVEYPSASPYVLSVGGTTLPLSGTETAWSSGGGGPSAYESKPNYQVVYGVPGTTRGTPDVSYDADPNTGVSVYDSTRYNGQKGWFQVGGTSAGAPQWAALIALADQGRSTPLTTADLTSRTEYNAATGSTTYASNYVDIISGNNGYPAGTGYDYATGVGSPRAQNLVPWLRSNA